MSNPDNDTKSLPIEKPKDSDQELVTESATDSIQVEGQSSDQRHGSSNNLSFLTGSVLKPTVVGTSSNAKPLNIEPTNDSRYVVNIFKSSFFFIIYFI